MEYMYEAGFLGTRAPFFMDFVMIMVAVLPFLVLLAIGFAKKRQYQAHVLSQSFIYLVALIVVGYFEYGVRSGGGYEVFAKGSPVSHNYLLYVLIFHIFIAVVGFLIWTATMVTGFKSRKRGFLPGKDSRKHAKAGKRAFVAIILTSVTGIWVYILLFMT